jgi:hypothetical protein
MSEKGMSLLDALSHVKGMRPIIFPNAGFQQQLYDFSKQLMKSRVLQQEI